jgi:hypothetical protein
VLQVQGEQGAAVPALDANEMAEKAIALASQRRQLRSTTASHASRSHRETDASRTYRETATSVVFKSRGRNSSCFTARSSLAITRDKAPRGTAGSEDHASPDDDLTTSRASTFRASIRSPSFCAAHARGLKQIEPQLRDTFEGRKRASVYFPEPETRHCDSSESAETAHQQSSESAGGWTAKKQLLWSIKEPPSANKEPYKAHRHAVLNDRTADHTGLGDAVNRDSISSVDARNTDTDGRGSSDGAINGNSGSSSRAPSADLAIDPRYARDSQCALWEGAQALTLLNTLPSATAAFPASLLTAPALPDGTAAGCAAAGGSHEAGV